ncbi:LysR substrate-binding domain-containing protein [Paraburkholderia fungorum]|uniref:LysR substrate-binding domain-containing protein n=1 Tax=Paraburkholderia fungorum TaxID=134537 RepID=UPI0038B85B18
MFAPELILELKRRAPQVNVALHEATSDRLFPMLANGSLDFVLEPHRAGRFRQKRIRVARHHGRSDRGGVRARSSASEPQKRRN